MKNDKLLKAFTQSPLSPITRIKQQLSKNSLIPLDSGELVNVKGGGTDSNPTKTN